MEFTVLIFGSVGAWLLVAGPVYQAALELQERALDPADFGEAFASTPPPRRVATWWWLLPPVAYVIRRAQRRIYLQHVMASLPIERRSELVQFSGKALGWLIVAAGALFIALKETWELVESLEWGVIGFVAVSVGVLFICVLHTALRMRIGRRAVAPPTRVRR